LQNIEKIVWLATILIKYTKESSIVCFPDIDLPDSSHHGQNEGMFIFRIKTKTGLPDSTWIVNKAGIYFDINPVIWTNEAANMICNACTVTNIAQIKPT
jgi:hypothetical protein